MISPAGGDVTNIDPTSGLSPTVHAIKNPTPAITYDSSNHDRFAPGDASKRAFTYAVLTGGRFIYASAIRLAVLKFILSMTASQDVLALANLEVELGNIQKGQTVTVKWRGKPVFIRHRTAEDISLADGVDVGSLRDPEADDVRVKDKDWLIVLGVCTHLGCVPLPNAGDYHGWFCPVRWAKERRRARQLTKTTHEDNSLTRSLIVPYLDSATEAITIRAGGSGRGRRRTTWRCRAIASWRTTRC